MLAAFRTLTTMSKVQSVGPRQSSILGKASSSTFLTTQSNVLQLSTLLQPTHIEISDDSAKHRHHAAMRNLESSETRKCGRPGVSIQRSAPLEDRPVSRFERTCRFRCISGKGRTKRNISAAIHSTLICSPDYHAAPSNDLFSPVGRTFPRPSCPVFNHENSPRI